MNRLVPIVVAVLALSAIGPAASAEDPGLTREEAFEKAVCFSGFEPTPEAADSVRDAGTLANLGPAGVPFLKPSHSESSFWSFDFGVVAFGKDTNRSTTVVQRPVIVLVESVRNTGLVWIRSVKPGYDPSTYAWDTASVVDSLYPPRRGYDGIPRSCPPYSLGKLLVTQPIGVGEPALIDAVCLISSWMRANPGPAWIVLKHDYTSSAQLRSSGDVPHRWVRHGFEDWNALTAEWTGSGSIRMGNEEWPISKIGGPLMNW